MKWIEHEGSDIRNWVDEIAEDEGWDKTDCQRETQVHSYSDHCDTEILDILDIKYSLSMPSLRVVRTDDYSDTKHEYEIKTLMYNYNGYTYTIVLEQSVDYPDDEAEWTVMRNPDHCN